MTLQLASSLCSNYTANGSRLRAAGFLSGLTVMPNTDPTNESSSLSEKQLFFLGLVDFPPSLSIAMGLHSGITKQR